MRRAEFCRSQLELLATLTPPACVELPRLLEAAIHALLATTPVRDYMFSSSHRLLFATVTRLVSQACRSFLPGHPYRLQALR